MKMTDAVKKQIARWGNYSKAFSTVYGEAVLLDLEHTFDGSSFDPQPFVMAKKAGQREVILFIKEMIARGSNPTTQLSALKAAEEADLEQEE